VVDPDPVKEVPKVSYPRSSILVMTVSARDVAAALRARLPGVPTKKLHKLLYYCQGHHLAHFDRPLFAETISAWDMGPVVGQLWKAEREGATVEPPAVLGEAELNTIGYVVSRYGALTGLDLEHLTHAEDPWRLADRERPSGGSVRIEREWMRDYFRSATADHEEGEVWFAKEAIARLVAGADERRVSGQVDPDTRDALQARIDEARARLTSA
jgi:uncharacterized phage-associated protein